MKIFKKTFFLAALAAASADIAAGEAAAEVAVDFSRPAGAIRPLHGGNCGPLNLGDTVDLSAYHREIAIPYTRLHDCHWPNPDVVDIHALFPDFRADPERPESYAFTRTDGYIQAIAATGSRIVYRLGESIEHTKVKYHVHPPTDFEKWTAVCAGIVRHYNEGWAGGLRLGIRHWEIWNEPENRPAMWTGTDEDYYRLYSTASKALKARFPDILIGGPAVGDTGPVSGGVLMPTKFLAGFLRHVKETRSPLDFFSWHTYTSDPSLYARKARAIRRWLDESGFGKAEMHLNEWNYLPRDDWTPMLASGQGKPRELWYGEIGGAPGAAFSAYVLISLQDSPVDVANYYAAEVQGFGLFNFHGVPKKTYHAFRAFKALADAPERVEAAGGEPAKLAVLAGLNQEKNRGAILLSNFSSPRKAIRLAAKGLPFEGPSVRETFILDSGRDLEKVGADPIDASGFTAEIDLPAPSVALVVIRKKEG